MWALFNIVFDLENLVLWRGCPCSSLVGVWSHWVILLGSNQGWNLLICGRISKLGIIKIIPVYWMWHLWWFTIFGILIWLGSNFIALIISILLNGGVWVWGFKSLIQSYLCWFRSFLSLVLKVILEVTVHGSSTGFQLLVCLSMTLLILQMLLFTKHALFAWICCARWTFVPEGPNHVIWSLVRLLIHLVSLIWNSHLHRGWWGDAQLVYRGIESSSTLLYCPRGSTWSGAGSLWSHSFGTYDWAIVVSLGVLAIYDEVTFFWERSAFANASVSCWLRLQHNLLIH